MLQYCWFDEAFQYMLLLRGATVTDPDPVRM